MQSGIIDLARAVDDLPTRFSLHLLATGLFDSGFSWPSQLRTDRSLTSLTSNFANSSISAFNILSSPRDSNGTINPGILQGLNRLLDRSRCLLCIHAATKQCLSFNRLYALPA